MLRISWPLAALLALAIAIVARKPRLFWPMVIVFGIWFAWISARGRPPPPGAGGSGPDRVDRRREGTGRGPG